jgi:hypothetical protein
MNLEDKGVGLTFLQREGNKNMTEKIERIARTILWVVLAVSIVAIPLGVLKRKSEVDSVREEMKAALKIAEYKIAKLSEKKEPDLFPVEAIGIYLSGLNHRTAEGGMTFTNTSPRSGFLCLKGVATNPSAGTTSESIPYCKEINPYESSINLQFKFASGDLQNVCPKEDDCRFSVSPIDRPESKPKKPAPKTAHPPNGTTQKQKEK